MNKLQEIQV